MAAPLSFSSRKSSSFLWRNRRRTYAARSYSKLSFNGMLEAKLRYFKYSGAACAKVRRRCSFTVGLPIVIRSGKVSVVARCANYYRDPHSNGQVCRHEATLRPPSRHCMPIDRSLRLLGVRSSALDMFSTWRFSTIPRSLARWFALRSPADRFKEVHKMFCFVNRHDMLP